MRYTPIIGTLGYVLSPDKQSVLLVHRNARSDDDHLGKYNGLGGKMQKTEDIVTCMKREIYEESQLTCQQMHLCGTINWINFGPKQQDWLGFIFRIDSFTGTPLKENPEGQLEWVSLSKLGYLPMWEGDKHFLPLVFSEKTRTFHGAMRYDKEKVLSWTYTWV